VKIMFYSDGSVSMITQLLILFTVCRNCSGNNAEEDSSWKQSEEYFEQSQDDDHGSEWDDLVQKDHDELLESGEVTITGFYHVTVMGNCWKEIVTEQLKVLTMAGLPMPITYYSIALDLNSERIWEESPWTDVSKKIQEIEEELLDLLRSYGLRDKPTIKGEQTIFKGIGLQYECGTLNKLQNSCKARPRTTRQKGLTYYLHSKGVSHGGASTKCNTIADDDNIVKWRQIMQHFLFENWQPCYNALVYQGFFNCGLFQRFDDSGNKWGVQLRSSIGSHFSGNFWWSRCDWIAELDLCEIGTKYAAEAWVLRSFNGPESIDTPHGSIYPYFKNIYDPFPGKNWYYNNDPENKWMHYVVPETTELYRKQKEEWDNTTLEKCGMVLEQIEESTHYSKLFVELLQILEEKGCWKPVLKEKRIHCIKCDNNSMPHNGVLYESSGRGITLCHNNDLLLANIDSTIASIFELLLRKYDYCAVKPTRSWTCGDAACTAIRSANMGRKCFIPHKSDGGLDDFYLRNQRWNTEQIENCLIDTVLREDQTSCSNLNYTKAVQETMPYCRDLYKPFKASAFMEDHENYIWRFSTLADMPSRKVVFGEVVLTAVVVVAFVLLWFINIYWRGGKEFGQKIMQVARNYTERIGTVGMFIRNKCKTSESGDYLRVDKQIEKDDIDSLRSSTPSLSDEIVCRKRKKKQGSFVRNSFIINDLAVLMDEDEVQTPLRASSPEDTGHLKV